MNYIHRVAVHLQLCNYCFQIKLEFKHVGICGP